MEISKITYENIQKIFRLKQHIFIGVGNYPNLFGIRTESNNSNKFDDYLGFAYLSGNKGIIKVFPATTDSGKFYLENPINELGTGILAEGQYINVWGFGYHKGMYEALVQRNNVTVYRDNNKDSKIDIDVNSIQVGLFGMNLHHAGEHSVQVDKWSAMCQVTAKTKDFKEIFDFCKISGFKMFNYTLLSYKDFESI